MEALWAIILNRSLHSAAHSTSLRVNSFGRDDVLVLCMVFF